MVKKGFQIVNGVERPIPGGVADPNRNKGLKKVKETKKGTVFAGKRDKEGKRTELFIRDEKPTPVELPTVEPPKKKEEKFDTPQSRLNLELLESADLFEEQGFEGEPPKTLAEFTERFKRQKKEDLTFAQSQAARQEAIDQTQLGLFRQEAGSAEAGATAALAQGREGPMSAAAPLAVQQFEQTMGKRVDMAIQKVEGARAARVQQLKELKRAQQTGQEGLVDQIKARLAGHERDIQEAETEARNSMREAAEFAENAATAASARGTTTQDNIFALGSKAADLTPETLSTMITGTNLSLPQALTIKEAAVLQGKAAEAKNEAEAIKFAAAAEKMLKEANVGGQSNLEQETRFIQQLIKDGVDPAIIEGAKRSAGFMKDTAGAASYDASGVTRFEPNRDIGSIDMETPGENGILSYSKIFMGSSANAEGVDFAAPVNTPITAQISGQVVEVISDETAKAGAEGWGNRVVIQDEQGNRHTYNHLNSTDVNVGQNVTAGMSLGKSGNTGRVMGADGEELSQEQINSGRGAHLDYTVFRPDGTKYTVGEAAGFAFGSSQQVDPEQLQQDIIIALAGIPTQLRNSAQEQERYERAAVAFLKKGLSPLEVQDSLLGFNIETLTPDDQILSRRLRTIAFQDEEFDVNGLARLVNTGQFTEAMIKAENSALKSIDQDFADTSKAEQAMSLIDRANNLYKDLDGKAVGSWDKINQKWKMKVTPEFRKDQGTTHKAAELQSILTDMSTQIRNQRFGSALTKTENKLIEPFIVEIENQPDIAQTKLKALESSLLAEVNATRRIVGLPSVNANQLADRDARLGLYKDSPLPQTPAPNQGVTEEVQSYVRGNTNTLTHEEMEQVQTLIDKHK